MCDLLAGPRLAGCPRSAWRWGRPSRCGGARIDGVDDLLVDTPVLRRLRWLTRGRAERFVPIRLVGVDADGQAATARLRTRDDDLWVVHVEVEAVAPHRITLTHTQRRVPDYLTPGSPADFTGAPMTATDGAVLVVGGGVAGSGKSAVAERVGAALDIAVFALDWLLGALTLFGLDDLGRRLRAPACYEM